jgi:hypothetical protein
VHTPQGFFISLTALSTGSYGFKVRSHALRKGAADPWLLCEQWVQGPAYIHRNPWANITWHYFLEVGVGAISLTCTSAFLFHCSCTFAAGAGALLRATILVAALVRHRCPCMHARDRSVCCTRCWRQWCPRWTSRGCWITLTWGRTLRTKGVLHCPSAISSGVSKLRRHGARTDRQTDRQTHHAPLAWRGWRDVDGGSDAKAGR